jgi:hypothetical protein
MGLGSPIPNNCPAGCSTCLEVGQIDINFKGPTARFTQDKSQTVVTPEGISIDDVILRNAAWDSITYTYVSSSIVGNSPIKEIRWLDNKDAVLGTGETFQFTWRPSVNASGRYPVPALKLKLLVIDTNNACSFTPINILYAYDKAG